MTTDFLLPIKTGKYDDLIDRIVAMQTAQAMMLNVTGLENIPTDAIRWGATNSRFEKYVASAWVELCAKYMINVDTLDGLHAADLALVGHNHSSTYQPLAGNLTAYAALSLVADKLAYANGTGTLTQTDFTSLARTICGRTTASQILSDLGAVIGTNVQAYNANLTALANTVAAILAVLASPDVATMRSNMGLGSAALLAAGVSSGDVPVLDANGRLLVARLGSGTPDGTKFLRDDGTWVAVSALPVGASVGMAGETVPAGMLEENGAAVSRTAYSALFAYIGTAHGQGDGSTTFNLPDSRGEHHRGWDHGRGVDPDRATRTAAATGGATGDHVGSYQADAYKAHTHDLNVYSTGDPAGSANQGGNATHVTAATGSSGGNETRGRNKYRMYCIKY